MKNHATARLSSLCPYVPPGPAAPRRGISQIYAAPKPSDSQFLTEFMARRRAPSINRVLYGEVKAGLLVGFARCGALPGLCHGVAPRPGGCRFGVSRSLAGRLPLSARTRG